MVVVEKAAAVATVAVSLLDNHIEIIVDIVLCDTF